ncbi:dockerin type I domain-containing protein [Ruminococcus sp.]|uniref:RCC1 domain-containing protein n=1 Tax=Ruminococcus sp. TaxID=41978 RepID=UPI003AEF9515
MKRQQFFSKFLAITLVATIIFSVFTVSVSAVTNDENASAQNASIQNNLSVQGTNSVGAMLANEIEDKNEETEENNGCNVFSVAVAGNNAVISFETIVDATLLVAIYNESCDTLIATGTTEVKKGETERNVTLDTEDMPQYFYVKGYLIDTATNKPLCTAYSSPMYTKEMQEFLAKTTDDFDENKVLNFDNEDDNNFAVYNEDVKLVDDSGDKNKVTKSDDTTKTYVIENIDESISSLNEGDIFSYNYSDGDALVVKIAKITIDGTTATITAADTELDEVFDYVKIDSTAKKSDFTYDDSNLSDELKVEEASSRSRTSRAVDMEASAAFSTGFAINYSPNDTISVTGSLSFGLSVSAKVYVSLSYQYLELISKQSLGVEISVSATMFSHDFSLGEYGVFPVPGLYISIEPAVSFEGEIEVSFGASVETQFGFSVSSSEGYKDLSKAAEIKTELKVKGKLFIGLKVTGKVKLLGAVAEGGISGKIGPEISAEFAETGNNEDYKHDCGTCLKGEINYIKGISVYAKFFNLDKLKFEWSASKSYKGGDFYYSFDYNQFGFTTCPHITYKVTVAVRDKSKKPVSGATVNGTETTDSNGIAILYLPNGNHSITASYSGQAESTVLTVNNAATSAELVFGGSQGNTDYDFTPTGEIAPIAAGSNHSAAVTKDGDLYMWGSNGGGRLGNGSRTNSYTPVKIMKNVAAVSLGDEHSAAVTKDGSLYMWGNNYSGQLGNGSTTNRSTPVKIMEKVAAVSLGGNHSAAITKDGGLYTWGDNYFGQLGNGSIKNSDTPIKIMSNVVSSAGGSHTIALKKNGTVYTWGDNEYGEFGNGNKSNQTSPVAIQFYDRNNAMRAKQALEPVGASSAKHTAKFAGYTPNGIYNFYSLKDKNVDKLLTDDNVLYVDQVRADANGNISVTYTPKADCYIPYEFVASITQINLSNAEVTAENLNYNGKTQAVKPVVKVNDYTLYEGIDYTLTGAYEAKNAGEYTYTIVGKGDFVGYTTKTFTINTVDVNDCKVSSINSVPYSGKEIQPDVAVAMDGYTLAKDVDYTVEYQNNLNVGIGIVVIKGIGNFTGRNICLFDITRCDISTISKIVVKNCEYSGKAAVPEMILENNGIALVKDKDYTVTFKNNTSVGTATAVISGIGNYSGTVEKAFTIGYTMVGDVDMNGKVDVNDVTSIMKYNVDLINLSSEQLKFADVNEDDYVDILDATLLQQYIANCVS